ncbi:DUF4919 domain-containing protein [Chryseobacterium oryctis]|uniref:DUF4919 domain-containing protein n=1 Tax=Chryseobacterium oryctis TaxID=2952618 RepID=A0ABT3HLD5_9FLAO|nr:DUF4919 domain-containing protein [Chryseobacterium oryctis]MCW3160595.1 DUF4919 domain-containing protein [Chryseobacterium oryctis]
MKKYLFFLLIFISILGFGQKLKLDLKVVEKNLKNSHSPYNYDKLIFKYKAYPQSVDSIEAQHLYYGRNFKDNLVSTSEDEFKKLAEAFKNKNFDECISQGNILFQKDPTNMDILLILLRAYDSKEDGNKFTYHLNQFRLLSNAIKFSGDGKSEKTAYIVNSVGDEYILLNMLKVGEEYTRGSKALKDGMLDIWQKEDDKIYIKILYLNF